MFMKNTISKRTHTCVPREKQKLHRFSDVGTIPSTGKSMGRRNDTQHTFRTRYKYTPRL